MSRFLNRAAAPALILVVPVFMAAVVPAPAFSQAKDLGGSLPYTSKTEVLVRQGDFVPGLGRVVSIGRVAVNDRGSWLVEVCTDHPDEGRDEAVLRDGDVVWTEGQTLAGLPAGPRIRRIDTLGINTRGDTCWGFTLAGTPGGESDDSVLFFNSRVLLQEGRPVLATGVPPGTPYLRLLQVKLNGEGDALLLSNLRRAGASAPVGRALFHLDLDLDGTMLKETPIALDGDAPAALGGDTIVGIDSSPHALAFNDRGEALYVARTSESAGGRYALLKNDTLIAREGAPCAQAPGRSWRRLLGTTVALNGAGSVFFRGTLDGDPSSDDVLVLDDTLHAREGQELETVIGTYPIRGFAYTTPLGLGEGGDTLYFAFLDKPYTKNVVAVLNGRVVLQEDVTLVEDTWIEALIEPPHLEYAALSPDASKLVIECRLVGVGEAAILVDLARLPERFCNASDSFRCPCSAGANLSGCDNAAGTGGVRLRLVDQRQASNKHTTGVPVAGPPVSPANRNRATMIGTGFDLAARAAILLRGAAREAQPQVFGDGLRCLQRPLVRMSTAVPAGGLSRHTFGHGVAAGTGTFHYQLWYGDFPVGYCDPVAGFNLSSGRSLSWE